MRTFTISVADIAIRIRPIYPEIQSFFQGYLSTDTPCFEIAACKKDLEKELQKLTDDNIKDIDKLTEAKEKELFAI